ncbi:hypothetical protein Vadar_018804 [Vaccinium darrowii]|uniref:Uncharacterized protein n=1 Tax=Vaccinium darrowii TaxID=229202 RepID=A0ACB7Y0P2_9ERIC|nr:hypothetical protein Vadar_018804 [Vaccinium darrowii]
MNISCSNNRRTYNNTFSVDNNLCIICGNQKVLHTSWTDQNPGRRFVKCTNNDCNDFGWVDPPMCRRSTQIIPGLLRRINKMEMELQKSKATKKKMKMLLVGTWILLATVFFYHYIE